MVVRLFLIKGDIMSNKLLNIRFLTTDLKFEITIGGSSTDHLPPTGGTNWDWLDSRTDGPLNQSGCCVTSPDSGRGLNATAQRELYVTLVENLGYSSNVALVPSIPAVDTTKYYLNGKDVDENNIPQPYLMYVSSGHFVPQLEYFKADGTSLGAVYTNLYYGDASHNYAVALLGQIYDDGSFKGQRALLYAHGSTFRRYKYRIISDYSDITTQVVNQAMLDDVIDYLPVEPEGGGAGGGEGDFDGNSDTIGIPELPTANALATGMCAMYKMDAGQLQGLSTYLWTTNFVDLIKKLLNDPMESIFNLSIVPLDLTAGSSAYIKIGNVVTTASGHPVSNPYKQLNFGTINLHEYWGGFIDYSPYTKLSIYLPYIGFQDISIDDVMNGAIQLKANCDSLTGAVTYLLYSVQSNWAGHSHASVLYSWGGNMQYQIPLTASNYSAVVSSLIGTAGTIAGGVAVGLTGGMTAPVAVGTATAGISNVMNAKTHVQHGGGLGGSMGLFGVQTPYLILERPEQIYPENYEHTIGTPNESTRALAYFSNNTFVKVRGVHMEIESATNNELNEIEELLKAGVVI